MTATVNANALARVIANAALFAGTDDTLPILQAVHLDIADGKITAVCTDRYTLGTDWTYLVDAGDDSETWSFNLPTAEVAGLVKWLKAEPALASVDLEREDLDEPSIGDRLHVKSWTGPERIVFEQPGEFPKTGTLLTRFENLDPERHVAPTVAYTPKYLARFAKVLPVAGGRYRPAMRMDFLMSEPIVPAEGATAPAQRHVLTRVTFGEGEHFVGAIMPVNLA